MLYRHYAMVLGVGGWAVGMERKVPSVLDVRPAGMAGREIEIGVGRSKSGRVSFVLKDD